MGVSVDQIAKWEAEYGGLDGEALLRPFLTRIMPGRIALSSSFGADAAILLHMVSRIDRDLPILFIDTGMLFPETLAYRDQLIDAFGLTTIKVFGPKSDGVVAKDPDQDLYLTSPNACCALRKVEPLNRALDGYDGWITGRKRYQASTRSGLPVIERIDGRLKLNPLAPWDRDMVEGYIALNELPEHPLVHQGYPSIGCMPCTTPVAPGEDPRAGRWRGSTKTECGLHFSI